MLDLSPERKLDVAGGLRQKVGAKDGWVEVRVPWQPGESLASWVLSFGPEAEAVDTPELRAEVVGALETLARA